MKSYRIAETAESKRIGLEADIQLLFPGSASGWVKSRKHVESRTCNCYCKGNIQLEQHVNMGLWPG